MGASTPGETAASPSGPAVALQDLSATTVYRIVGDHSPLAFRPWHLDDELVNRFDDPFGEYRVLYTADSAAGALSEKLQALRPNVRALAAARLIVQDDDRFVRRQPSGKLPRSWLASRNMAAIRILEGTFAQIAVAESVAALRERLAPWLAQHSVQELDVSSLVGPDRALTNRVSREVYSLGVAGIVVPSKLGLPEMNVALFEEERSGRPRAQLALLASTALDPNNIDLCDLLRQFRIEVDENS